MPLRVFDNSYPKACWSNAGTSTSRFLLRVDDIQDGRFDSMFYWLGMGVTRPRTTSRTKSQSILPEVLCIPAQPAVD